MDKDLYNRFIKSLKEHNVSIEALKKDIKKKDRYRELQLRYNKKKYEKFNRFD